MLRTFVNSIKINDDTGLLDWLFWFCCRNWILRKSVYWRGKTRFKISVHGLSKCFRDVLFVIKCWLRCLVYFRQLMIRYLSDFGDFFFLQNGNVVVLASVLFVRVFFVLFSSLSRKNSLDQICYLFARNYARVHIVGMLLENVAHHLVYRELFT